MPQWGFARSVVAVAMREVSVWRGDFSHSVSEPLVLLVVVVQQP